jgi:uncharacterized protein YndB with AHSA1/START domain
MSNQLPQFPVEATVERTDGRWTLRMERQLDYPPERVWAALTRATEIRRWAPYAPDRDLDQVGEVPLPQSEGGTPAEGEAEPGRVLEIDPPRLLVLLWGNQQLRYELTPASGGVRLVLRHTFDAPTEAPEYAAGWHLCLAALAARVDGQDVPPVAGSAARKYGWVELRDEYAGALTPVAWSSATK